jgi:hypothetical protein
MTYLEQFPKQDIHPLFHLVRQLGNPSHVLHLSNQGSVSPEDNVVVEALNLPTVFRRSSSKVRARSLLTSP